MTAMRSLVLAATMLGGISGYAKAGPQPHLIPALERLAAAGNAEALYHLGMAYHTGTGVPVDHAKALDFFRRAAAAGDPLAAYKLGCYYGGQGAGLVAPDQAQALRYKLVSATAGYALAQQDVGAIYANQGAMKAARDWFGKAAAQGWPDALLANASIYNVAPGIPRDPALTAAYFRLFLNRAKASSAQQDWLAAFEAKLSLPERERAAAIVRDYRPAPTALTLAGLSGQRAAERLIAGKP